MTTNVTGVVLAGGKSSRMGQDKGLLKWNGQELIAFTLEVLRQVTDEILIVSGNSEYLKFNVPVFKDLVPDKGPLGGIQTALKYSRRQNILVATCDNPALSGALLKGLIHEHGESDVTIVEEEGSGLNPFPCLINQRIGSYLGNCMEDNRLSMRQLFSGLDVKSILSHKYDTDYRPANINTKEDLEAL